MEWQKVVHEILEDAVLRVAKIKTGFEAWYILIHMVEDVEKDMATSPKND